MATKLNAFLASVPANANVSSPPNSASAVLDFSQLESTVAPENVGPISLTTLQSPMTRHRHLSSQRTHNASPKLSVDSTILSQKQDRPEDDRNLAQPSLLKTFMATQAAAAKMKVQMKTHDVPVPDLRRRSSSTDLDTKTEAGPLRMTSMQGSHRRRVSTDTTLFNRYLRQQADRDISHETVQHFANVPIITATAASPDALGSEMVVDNNAEMENAVHMMVPEEILAVFGLGGTIPVSSALEIIRRGTMLMSLEQNVISLRAPYTLVGDLHGQFQDLLELFRVHGSPAVDNPFLFLGDYVDRGISSCEIILLLLAYKIAFPESVHLLRGNHECRSLSTFYGFRVECLQKYGPVVYNRMIKCFESMPLAARLETAHGTFLAVHGGLSPDIVFVEDINGQVNRFMEPEPNGALCDLLWSDPAKGEAQKHEWAPNGIRGCSFTFNEHACREFLRRNNLLAVIRAHELAEDGYKEHFRHEADRLEENKAGDLVLPAVVTVFSAPEYCNTNHNVGATLKIPWEKQNGRLLQYQQHKRSQYLEFEFTSPSEDEAVTAFLEKNLPFLPIDFYDLVNVCRQLRSTLKRAASTTSDSSLKLSLVSSLCAPSTDPETKIKEDVELFVASPSSALATGAKGKDNEHSARGACEVVGESLQDWELVAETKCIEGANARKLEKDMKTEKKEKKLREKLEKKKQKEKKWITNRIVSGWKFCPGFVRLYDRYFAHDSVNKCGPEIASPSSHLGKRVPWIPSLKRSTSTHEAVTESGTNDTVTETSGRVRRKTMTDWIPMPSFERVAQLTNTLQGHIPVQGSGINVFTKAQWQALKLCFSILDLDGSGVLVEESFVVLLAEQDTDAYATEDELSLLMEVMDCNADCMITEQDFLLFAYRALLRWKRALHGSGK
ncbi:unnamed protein product [Peronospora farinosa]|uniref:Serine/threonine-protein phosphatase n=1 Tax=Peronospora farinosa TaxID=134698 RepID=A0AAV0T790_9STRA|nr:unnamed protein product [Peronospora farinosa]CAI5713996.1 unnamed protein product [Peronospora farinosa]